ncbi:hypothetical protein E4T39_04267 [Aureobasidium subglaciale]|nr:hypothetical protein E4T39_04267 [Aureobasidium subglaciale]
MQVFQTADRQRKSHKKSRFGCVPCKKRHIKCDEVLPQCGNCVKYKKECTLTRSNETAKALSISRPSRTLSPSSHADLPLPTLELLHHCTVGMAASGPTFLPNTHEPTRLGLVHPYVLHSLLSLSALHLFSIQPHRTELLHRASMHQHSALVQGRSEMIHPNRTNVRPILVFSGITALTAHAQPLYSTRAPAVSHDLLADLFVAFRLARGIKTLLVQNFHLLDIPAGDTSKGSSSGEEFMKLSLENDYPVLVGLRTLLRRCCDPEDLGPCLDATERLFLYMASLEKHPERWPTFQLVHQWPIDIPERVVDMMSARHQIGLVLLSYYAALMKLRSNVWPLYRWPELILHQVDSEIAPQFAVYVQWPKARILIRE